MGELKCEISSSRCFFAQVHAWEGGAAARAEEQSRNVLRALRTITAPNDDVFTFLIPPTIDILHSRHTQPY